MKKFYVLFVCIAGIVMIMMWPVGVQAGERDVHDLSTRERIFVGGFLGAQFGTFTTVSLSLHAGYRITNRLSAGIGGNYQYTNDSWFGQSFSSHVYGGNAFARFRVYSTLFLHAEFERVRLQSRAPALPVLDPDFDPDDRTFITENNYFVGAGYGLPMSDRIRLNLLLLYNFNQTSQAYQDNPVFRIGVDVYL